MNLPYRGALLTLVLALLLLAPPSQLVEREGAFVDTTAAARTGDAQAIDLGDGLRGNVAERLPLELGNWTGARDTTWNGRYQRSLQADELVVHDYTRPGILTSVQLMVLTARHGSAFHDPKVCFTGPRAGIVDELEPTTLPIPGDLGAGALPVGRMLVSYAPEDGRPPKLVYNVYIVEDKALAPDRTTWLRVMFFGVVPEALPAYDPILLELLELAMPHVFQGTASHRTTAGWVGDEAGIGWAAGAWSAAVAPLVAEAAFLRRRGSDSV